MVLGSGAASTSLYEASVHMRIGMRPCITSTTPSGCALLSSLSRPIRRGLRITSTICGSHLHGDRDGADQRAVGEEGEEPKPGESPQLRRGLRRKDQKAPEDHWEIRDPEMETKCLTLIMNSKGGPGRGFRPKRRWISWPGLRERRLPQKRILPDQGKNHKGRFRKNQEGLFLSYPTKARNPEKRPGFRVKHGMRSIPRCFAAGRSFAPAFGKIAEKLDLKFQVDQGAFLDPSVKKLEQSSPAVAHGVNGITPTF